MATIDKLNYLNETKGLIKEKLNNLGADITDDDTFRSYVEKINELYAEYPTEEYITAIQSIQPQNIQPQIIEQPELLNVEIQPLEQPQIIEEEQKETE